MGTAVRSLDQDRPRAGTLLRLLRDPMRALDEIAAHSAGAVVRLDLGLFRPYLVTRPEHVQQVLRDRAANYRRDGMMWRPMRRLLGAGIAGEGGAWAQHRRLVQPAFTARQVDGLVDRIADVVGTAVEASPTGEPVDAYQEMTRIVHQVVRRIFFADRVAPGEVDRLGAATTGILAALASRMVLPFMPYWVPMPGDATFRRAARTADEILAPLIRAAREPGGDGTDLVTRFTRSGGLDDGQVRDDLVALFVAGTESTAVALTWLWVLLDGDPEVAGQLKAEIATVVGAGPVGRTHLPALRYTRMVLDEVLRLHPPGWLIPRVAAGPDRIDGVPVRAGDTVLVSPYLTHRLPEWWERPTVFDPERFAPERVADRHPFAYFPFGAGPHRCLGSHFFTVEAQLVVAALLSRYRPRLAGVRSVTARLGASLRPRQRVRLVLAR
jgi:cytochrome P450